KLMTRPAWQVGALIGRLQRPKGEGRLGFLGRSLSKVRRAQGRLEQRIALLRHVEALRLYAAAHGGKLPAKLSDCPVPLPDDPFTGKPFRYEADGPTAHLRGGEVHYEVTLK